MTGSIHRLVYLSRNGITADREAEVAGILAVSRRNNTAADVTGALLFNDTWFGQVLEGPLHAVEATFERIQCDPRHDEITVLEITGATARAFPAWSMACVGRVAEDALPIPGARAAGSRTAAAAEVLDLLRELVLRDAEAFA